MYEYYNFKKQSEILAALLWVLCLVSMELTQVEARPTTDALLLSRYHPILNISPSDIAFTAVLLFRKMYL